MTISYEGGCQCRAIRFHAKTEPIFISNCHCESCRKASGGAFSTWVGFKAENAEWTKQTPSFHQSSPGVARGFCRDCGTPLSYAGEKWPNEIHFLVGVFDDPNKFVPNKDAFPDEALPWVQKFQ